MSPSLISPMQNRRLLNHPTCLNKGLETSEKACLCCPLAGEPWLYCVGVCVCVCVCVCKGWGSDSRPLTVLKFKVAGNKLLLSVAGISHYCVCKQWRWAGVIRILTRHGRAGWVNQKWRQMKADSSEGGAAAAAKLATRLPAPAANFLRAPS